MCEQELADFSTQIIAEIANGTTIKQLICTAADKFKLPIIVTDPGYHLIAVTNLVEINDPYWQQIIKNGVPSDQIITNEYFATHMPERIMQMKTPIMIDWGVCRNHPQTCGGIWQSDKLAGFVSILVPQASLKNLALKLNQLLCQFSAIILQLTRDELGVSIAPSRHILAEKIFDVNHYPNGDFLNPYADATMLQPTFQFAVVKSINADRFILNYLQSKLWQQPQLYCQLEKKQLRLLLQQMTPEKEAWLRQLLSQYAVKVGLSQLFDSMMQRGPYLQQANLAVETQTSAKIVKYDAVYLEVIKQQVKKQIVPANLILPELKCLATYDKKHSLDLLSTLAIYLKLRNNIPQTAIYLHVHRNTLTYRLQKIKNLLRLDIDDAAVAWRLQVGLQFYLDQ